MPPAGSPLLRPLKRFWALPIVVIVVVVALCAIGPGVDEADTLGNRCAVVRDAVIFSGLPAILYILSALGLGTLARPLLKDASEPWALQLALGVAIQLTITHAAGCAGVLTSSTRAQAIILPGLVLLAARVVRDRRALAATINLPWSFYPAAIALGLLLVASASPPGWLWASEFGGFDALSYHLQLPREWLRLGRVTPLDHNVYSYLPSYIESAFLHVGLLAGASNAPSGQARLDGLIAGQGDPLLAAQFLHASLAVGAGAVVARLSAAIVRRARPDAPTALPAGASAALVLLTPWTIVTGSLAYNEMAVVLLGAGAGLAAITTNLRPGVRGALTGLLVGVACGAKPTALFLVGAPVGILLVGVSPRRQWGALVAVGAAAGLIAIAPWLIRNALACGNPVFPFAASVFGAGHWSQEQVGRYASAHATTVSALDRLALLILPDSNDPAGARHRGLLHPQWGIFFPVLAGAAIVALRARATHIPAALLTLGMIAQLVLWLTLTHIQSRFLIPVLITGVPLAAVALVAFETPRWRSLGRTMGVAALILQGLTALLVFFVHAGGHPNAALVGGVPDRTGESFAGWFAQASPQERIDAMAEVSPEVVANIAYPGPEVLYLLGDSTPLYFRAPVIYHTTYDRSPLGEAMRAAPRDPDAWTRALRDRGVTLILVNFSELARLSEPKSPWYDPLVTPDAVQRWLDTQAQAVHVWPDSGRALYRLTGRSPTP